MSNYRTCPVCGQLKPIEKFTFQNRAKEKRKYICQPCDKIRQKDYYYKNHKKLLAWKQENYLQNRGKFLELQSNYRKNNKEKVRVSYEQWLSKNPDALRVNAKRRKARIRGAEIKKVTRKEIRKLLSLPCFYCGSLENLQIDHVVPIARGGRHSIGNLLTACNSCNASKNKWFITEWKMLKGKNVTR
jgi:5-methylcytosine-specific restriction endonuclease McrA